MTYNRGSIVPIIIILAVILSGGVYFYVENYSDSSNEVKGSTEKENTDLLAPAPEGEAREEIKSSNTAIPGYKTYTDAKVGFEFQYPETWFPVAMERPTGAFVAVAENPMLGQKSGGMLVAQFEKMTMSEAEARAASLHARGDGQMKYGAAQTVTLAGQKAVKQTYTSTITPNGIGYYFPEKGVVLTLTDLTAKESVKIQQNILASFRFTK